MQIGFLVYVVVAAWILLGRWPSRRREALDLNKFAKLFETQPYERVDLSGNGLKSVQQMELLFDGVFFLNIQKLSSRIQYTWTSDFLYW